jgi:hypothetical protein
MQVMKRRLARLLVLLAKKLAKTPNLPMWLSEKLTAAARRLVLEE